ncbi:MAG: hypothetical protein IKU68_03620 [Oscillospiraceae bacterium]|nr:hypothetical protein [Oscillospiraceae bacterium]
MYIYAGIATIAALVAGIIIAARTKRAAGVVYGKLDKAGLITNILLIPVYALLTLFFIALSLFLYPEYDGFLGLLGWIVAVVISSVPLYCGFALSASVVLRKKGKSRQSFAVQFAGLAGAAISLAMFFLFYGNLLSYLN